MERHKRSRSAPSIPPRRHVQSVTSSENVTSPPVPSRWGTCFTHRGQSNVAICKTCIELMCKLCLSNIRVAHKECTISFLNSDLEKTCHDVTCNLMAKITESQNALRQFERTLTSKRERMEVKRNETVAEIERYFVRLKEKLLQKLRREETELLNHLNGKVEEQDRVIEESIETCRDTLRVVDNKKESVRNMARLSVGVHPDVSIIGNLKQAIHASDEVKLCCKSQKEIEAARNGFMVIRFFVDSETEETVLNSKVASVEVLNSQAENQSNGNLEVERIQEAAQNVANENMERISPTTGDDNEELRVLLPPTPYRQRSVSPAPPNARHSRNHPSRPRSELRSDRSTNYGASSQRNSLEIRNTSSNELQQTPTSSIDYTPNGLGQESTASELPTPTAASPVELIDFDVTSDMASLHCSTPSISSSSSRTTPSPVFPPVVADTPSSTESLTFSVNVTDVISSPVTSQAPSPSTTADTNVNEALNDEDDPPPPYPGLPRTTPRPNEQPPPYPGPPPPPYSQNPDPQASSSTSGSDSVNPDRRLVSASDFCNLQEFSPRPRGNKVTRVFSVNEVYDKRSAGIFALAVVKGNGFVVVDRWNRKLKYFNSHGVSYGGLIFREEPWDVTLMTSELVTVTVPKMNTLYKIKVTDQSVIATGTVITTRKYACVAYFEQNQVFICGQVPQFGEPVVDVITSDGGTVLQSFRHDSEDRRDALTFSYPRYVKVTDEGVVIVCDWNLKCIMLFKLDGSAVGRYRGTVEFPLNEPTGMAYDAEKREIYVIDSKHTSTCAAIHTISLACECKDIIRWESEVRVAPAISACQPGFAVGSKSGAVSLFKPSSRNSVV